MIVASRIVVEIRNTKYEPLIIHIFLPLIIQFVKNGLILLLDGNKIIIHYHKKPILALETTIPTPQPDTFTLEQLAQLHVDKTVIHEINQKSSKILSVDSFL